MRARVAAMAVAAFCTAFAGAAAAQGSVATDRAALEALYRATAGPGWTDSTNWLTDAPLSAWFGVTTDDGGRVTKLDLAGNGLAGPLPGELGSLANLEVLSLWFNALTGSIPGELGALANLRVLSLWSNELTGPIPGELGALANLEDLSLSNNRLTGPIPASLGSRVGLLFLELSGNALTGPIPSALGNLVILRRLDLGRNRLTGPVPPWLGSLTELKDLILAANALTGPIPSEVGNLRALQTLDLSYNWGLSGPLPAGLELPSLEELDILVTRACAPAAWEGRLAAIAFNGRRCGSEAEVTIDVAVVHTRAARDSAGGAAAIGAEIDLMIAETNEAYAASGVRHRVALVEVSEVSYVESGDVGVDFARLGDPSDGHLDEVHALRDLVGADLVHLILGRGERVNICGIADVGGAFGVTVQGCGGRIFAHELGHNLGLVHDRYTNHGSADGGHAHPAYGYVNQRGLAAGAPEASRWITIMAYRNQCGAAAVECHEPLLFSNPRQRHAGDPLGVAFGDEAGPADTVAVLETTAPAVAAWRDRRPRRANRPPVAVGSLPDRRLVPRGILPVDVSRAFVDPDGDALDYAVSSSATHVVTAGAAGARLTLTAVGAGAAEIRVTATDYEGLGATQPFTVTVSLSPPFTDDPIRLGVTPIKALHFTELRMRIHALRRQAGLERFPWTDPVLTGGVTPVRLVHLLELRTALAEAYAAAGRAAPRWTDEAAAGGTPIRAVHLMELRAAVVELE